jgi:hypothetical protein
MIIFDVQSAVYGAGSGNAPELHVVSLAHLTTAFLLLKHYNATHSKKGHARARLRRI